MAETQPATMGRHVGEQITSAGLAGAAVTLATELGGIDLSQTGTIAAVTLLIPLLSIALKWLRSSGFLNGTAVGLAAVMLLGSGCASLGGDAFERTETIVYHLISIAEQVSEDLDRAGKPTDARRVAQAASAAQHAIDAAAAAWERGEGKEAERAARTAINGLLGAVPDILELLHDEGIDL